MQKDTSFSALHMSNGEGPGPVSSSAGQALQQRRLLQTKRASNRLREGWGLDKERLPEHYRCHLPPISQALGDDGPKAFSGQAGSKETQSQRQPRTAFTPQPSKACRDGPPVRLKRKVLKSEHDALATAVQGLSLGREQSVKLR